MRTFDVIVVGGGAAGLMCAIEAGRRGLRVAVLDHAERIGKKILISGGGRCNFTNLHCGPENFLSENAHFAKSALARYTPADFVALVEKHGIRYHEKTLGQLFCDGSAREIVAMLEGECVDAGVKIFVTAKITNIHKGDEFVVTTITEIFSVRALVVATGGLSIPRMGATPLGYEIAVQFGIRVIPCRPALVPLLFDEEDVRRWCDLAGLSAEVVATSDESRTKARFREKMLITHRGVSGPAVLQVSSYWRDGRGVTMDLAPGRAVLTGMKETTTGRDVSRAKELLRGVLPQRLAERWLEVYAWKGWTNAAIDGLEEQLHRWAFVPAGTEGYEKAEVTAGGVATDELDAKTMESRRVPGLYFIGEVVDVTGHLGGFNFQWAWASGAAAGRAC